MSAIHKIFLYFVRKFHTTPEQIFPEEIKRSFLYTTRQEVDEKRYLR